MLKRLLMLLRSMVGILLRMIFVPQVPDQVPQQREADAREEQRAQAVDTAADDAAGEKLEHRPRTITPARNNSATHIMLWVPRALLLC